MENFKPTRRFASGIALLVLAMLVGTCGLCAATLYLFNPLVARGTLETSILFAGLAGLGMLFASGMVWQGRELLRERASVFIASIVPSSWVWVMAFFGAVGIGVAMLSRAETEALSIAYSFPIVHFIAATAPSLAMIAYAARRIGQDVHARAAFLNLAWGALGATTLALLSELIVGVIVLLIASSVLMSLPNSATQIQDLQRALQTAQRREDFSVLAPWLTNPFLVLGGLTYFAFFVPLIEEMLKTLPLALMNSRTTRRHDACMWGLCAGAGFALAENVFNAGSLLSAWGVIILMRTGTALMHIANGAWLGRGWYAARVEGRWDRLVWFYGSSVVIHAIWNGAALALMVGVLTLSGATAPLPATLFVGAMGLLLVVLTLVALFSLVVMVRQVRESHF